VMSQQREVIYGIRNQILDGHDLREEILGLMDDLLERRLGPILPRGSKPIGEAQEEADRPLGEAAEELERLFLMPFPLARSRTAPQGEREEAPAGSDGHPLMEHARRIAREAYAAREAEWGPEAAREIERQVYLRVIDEHWKDHLYDIDLLRGGIGLRAYGQKDPVLEYKAESFQMFESLMERIGEDTLRLLFRVQVRREPVPLAPPTGGQAVHPPAAGLGSSEPAQPAPAPASATAPAAVRRALGAPSASGTAAAARGKTVVRTDKKVGRNDPCPCGSGKKYKHCCGAT
jgi:preprotein translocase subunit SecA